MSFFFRSKQFLQDGLAELMQITSKQLFDAEKLDLKRKFCLPMLKRHPREHKIRANPTTFF